MRIRPVVTPSADRMKKNTMKPRIPNWAICMTKRRTSGLPQASAARPMSRGRIGNRLITACRTATEAAIWKAKSRLRLSSDRNTAAISMLRNATTR